MRSCLVGRQAERMHAGTRARTMAAVCVGAASRHVAEAAITHVAEAAITHVAEAVITRVAEGGPCLQSYRKVRNIEITRLRWVRCVFV